MATDLHLDGTALTPQAVAIAAAGPVRVKVPEAALSKVHRAWECATSLAREQPVYGRTTGVGANRTAQREPDRDVDIGLLRSHGTGSGPLLDPEQVRAGMIIRLNQILRGGSGLHPEIVTASVAALALQATPVVHTHGGIGTGDLTALGELALALIGEAPFTDGVTRHLWTPHPGDALPLISSNAFTAGITAIALGRTRTVVSHQQFIAALSLVALRGSRESLHPAVAQARPHAFLDHVCSRQAELAAASEHQPARVQDSYGLRAFPQVTATLHSSLAALAGVLEIEINAAPENPLIDGLRREVFHHGNFHASALGLALDAAKIALYSDASLALARLTDISSPDMTGLTPFLGQGQAANGIMLLEYQAAAALSQLRQRAAPASLGSIVISRGVENHSNFATQAAGQFLDCAGFLADLLACEAIAAHRGMTMQGAELAAESELAAYRQLLAACIEPQLDDRSLTTDLARVRDLLDHPMNSEDRRHPDGRHPDPGGDVRELHIPRFTQDHVPGRHPL